LFRQPFPSKEQARRCILEYLVNPANGGYLNLLLKGEKWKVSPIDLHRRFGAADCSRVRDPMAWILLPVEECFSTFVPHSNP
jgi:hypothetical protein